MERRVRRAYVDVEGLQTHYRTVRTANDLPALVLLHQTPLHSGVYERALPLLAEACRPFALDSPGYGQSDAPGTDWKVSDYARWVWRAADALGISETFLFGRATGSAFAVGAAVSEPGRTRGLIAHGLALYEPEELEFRRNSDYGHPIEPRRDGTHLIALWGRIMGQYPYLSPSEAQWNLEAYLAAGPDFATGYRAIWRYDVRSAVTDVSAPILLLGGTRDRIFHWFEPARRLLEDVETAVIEDATDFVAIDDPEAFTLPIRDFVRRHQ